MFRRDASLSRQGPRLGGYTFDRAYRKFRPQAVRLIERMQGVRGGIHDGVDYWTRLDRGGLAGGDLRFHLCEQERAIGGSPVGETASDRMIAPHV